MQASTSRRARTTVRRSLAVVGVAALAVAAALTTTTPAGAAPSTTGLLSGPGLLSTAGGGLWHLDEENGTTVAYDSSGFGNNGVLLNRPVPGQAGYVGTAYSFANTGSWVRVDSSPTLNPGGATFTYGAALKLTTAPTGSNTYDIIRKGVTTTVGGEFKMEVVKYGKIRCTAKDADGHRAAILGPAFSVADNAWHTAECGRDGAVWHVTVDGNTRTKSFNLGSISNTKQLSIGSKYGQEDGTPGLVDEVYLSIASLG